MLITGHLCPPCSSQLITVNNSVNNRPVNNSSIVHRTLVSNIGSADDKGGDSLCT